MSIVLACVGRAASYAEERINASQRERVIRKIILSAPLHKMTIIYLQELIGLAINTHESMFAVPGAFQHPPPFEGIFDCSRAEGLY